MGTPTSTSGDFPQIGGPTRHDKFQVVLFEGFVQPHGDGIEVTACEATVGRIAFRQDLQKILFQNPAFASSLVHKKPPMLARPSFFADMVQPSA